MHKEVILSLNKIGAIKFGEFKLKSGAMSPIYITLRILISYPEVMRQVAEAYVTLLEGIEYDRMAAVPYAAMPIVAAISALNEKPWVYTRKEQKDYGIKRPMEGEFKPGDTVVIVDDLINNGASKFEVIAPFEAEGLKVKDVVVLVDRESGGQELLAEKGYQLHSVLKLSEILEVLQDEGIIDDQMVGTVNEFVAANKVA